MPSSKSALPRSVSRANEMTIECGSTSMTRRVVVAGLAVAAAPVSQLATADDASAQATQTAPEKSLYERLGGVFAIAAVVDHFSDAVVKNPVVGQKSKNPQLREWHTKNLGRLPGLKLCGRFGSAAFRAGPFSTRPPDPVRRRLVLRRPIGICTSPRRNSMRLQQNSDGRWISSRFPSARRAKFCQPSPPTRAR